MQLYRLSELDLDSYAFRDYPELTENQRVHQEIIPDMSGNSRPGLRRCESCGELLDKWNESLAGLVVKKRKLDIGCTYDGVTVVSERFKAAYDAAGLSGLTFRQLPNDPTFYAIRPERAVKYDAERRGTRFVKQCPQCGCYESVVGATPIYLKPGSTIGASEFVRTDLEFGSDDEKSPLILCGESTADALNTAKLKGLDLERVKEP
ncbi:MAG: hypothetical protein KF847_13650 [Pirellulales bacterium]|nr:hypothetical protein [Pirellulales bacterium]